MGNVDYEAHRAPCADAVRRSSDSRLNRKLLNRAQAVNPRARYRTAAASIAVLNLRLAEAQHHFAFHFHKHLGDRAAGLGPDGCAGAGTLIASFSVN